MIATMSMTHHLPAAIAASHAPIGERWSPPYPSDRPTTVMRRGPVVALRQRPTIAVGSLAERSIVSGEHLVTARDEAGQGWWIPAEAVWSDADSSRYPEHPRPIGLATAGGRESALLKGLSDRLGWEAVAELERGGDLPAAGELSDLARDDLVFLDGRLDHDVPTVLVLGSDVLRWGAGSTWDGALRRAMYGDDADTDAATELVDVSTMLARSDLAVTAVDLDTPLLRRAGIVRCSVQLVASNGAVRSWDAPLVN